jgi:hypothetical protein
MITINGFRFYDQPARCRDCSFYDDGTTERYEGRTPSLGLCVLWGEMHRPYCTVPRRCDKLFTKAFTFANGEELIITRD